MQEIIAHALYEITTNPTAMSSSETDDYKDLRPDVLNYDDVRTMIPRLDGHEKLVNGLLHFLSVDKVNANHRKLMD
ncbi:MAG: hypothetical protein U0M50_07725, partial [Paramuribaculum sp.]